LNAVRLSHYPPDPVFLEACDELGLYVMNELGGWHGKYDTEVGKQLVKEMITRDLNHPSIVWWSNGNEGGWNTELDSEFHPWDPQKRPVLHPQGNFGGFETMHYRSYGESQEYMRKPEIFMPTEILHGLYDGGHGAGLWDYWEMMRKHPRCAGAFLWVFADEGVMRTDQNGRIDNVGNYGADGIVGPHHEKEGSFFTVREVWSPVQIKAEGQTSACTDRTEALRQDQNSFIADPETFGGKFKIENRYDFISLQDCRIKWSLANFSKPDDKNDRHEIINQGEQAGPKLAPHQSGELQLTLPANWKEADVLYVSIINPRGEEIYTWGWYWKSDQDYISAALPEQSKAASAKLSQSREGDFLILESGATRLKFDTKTAYLTEISKGDKKVSLSNGPRFIAARRGDRSMDVYYNHDDKTARSKERIYNDISGSSTLTSFRVEEHEDKIVFEADYFGNLNKVCWTITDQEEITVDYEYQYEGVVELAGICFDYPEEQMQGLRFLGKGPYRVWQNRMHGTLFDVWDKEYNDPIPGESFIYPEFKGYYNDWKWVDFQTTEARLWLGNGTAGSYLGVYTPRDGRDALLYTIPQSGIAVLDVIPGVRNKVNSTDLVGPSSQAKWLSGPQKGSLQIQVR
ncbi:MAG: glycoside hydrolase family 2 TIM barrel-domain containing protein, partial [Bacteroidales bacterium]